MTEQLMTKQLSIIDSLPFEQELFQRMRPSFEKTLNDNGFPVRFIDFKELKTCYSCTYNNYVFFQVHSGKKIQWIKISDRFYGILHSSGISMSHNGAYYRIDLQTNDLSVIEDILSKVLDKMIDDSGNVGCCSRYVQCSDEGHCIHPDPDVAVKCMYRVNLKHGKVFYGKNANK